MTKRVLSVLLALCLVVGMVPVFAGAASSEQYMRQVFELVNKERAKAGMASLGSNSKLNELANIRAKEIVRQFDHTRPNGSSCFTVFGDNGITSFAKMGENIAAGYSTPAMVMNAWMNSTSHRDNILDPEFQLVGIGCCQIPGDGLGIYWVQLFYSGDQLQADPFWDVPSKAYYSAPVVWALERGITKGTGKNTFSPEAKIKRQDVVTFLWRANGKPEPHTTKNPFTDIKEGDYYYKAVLWAVENKITTGTGKNTFSPAKVCTRKEIATFLWRDAGKTPPQTAKNPFTDVKPGDYYYEAVLWAVENKITKGTGKNTFSPGKNCTRGQTVTFLYRAME